MKRSTIYLGAAAIAGVLFSAIQLSARPEPTTSVASAAIPVQTSGAAFTFVVAPDSNAARYRVREQLAGFDIPNDAIGETRDVSGSIALDKSGKVIADASHIIVRIDSLKSDKARRDGYIRGRVLEASRFPTVDLQVTNIQGVKLPLPKSGSRAVTLTGNLTVHGVTRPTTWTGTAVFADSTIRGSASTKFTFTDFQLTQPRVPVVLSVADTIALEYDFKLVRSKAGK
jgi:polyisoprenoid-binding protein YceI